MFRNVTFYIAASSNLATDFWQDTFFDLSFETSKNVSTKINISFSVSSTETCMCA